MKNRVQSLFLPLALLAIASLTHTTRAQVAFLISPSVVSNTYNGTITLQVTGLTNAETVVVQKFLDLNTNGIVDAGDYLVQQFNLTDGQMGMVINSVTNFNVPGDTDGATNGQITARLNFQNGDFVQNLIGQYIFVLSSPVGHFAPITNLFNVTNFPYAQTITGNVVNNGTNVPNAVVLLSVPQSGGNNGPGTPVAGAVANGSGVYTIQAPAGAYVPFAISSSFVVNFSASPVLTLGSGATLSTNLTLANATQVISGQMVDATNSSIGLPGIFMPANSSANGQRLIAVCFSDTNGNYTEQVTPGQWGLGDSDSGLIIHGYVGWGNKTNVNAGTTGVTLAFPKATALFYGKVTNNLGSPLANIDIGAYDNNDNLYESDAYTETNGSYVLGVVGGLGSDDPWQVEYNANSSVYIFSQPSFDQNGGDNIKAGKAVLANFTGLLATNTISGNVETNGNPIIGVGVSANATIHGAYYNLNNVDTDTNGNYSLTVANGTWSVNVSCQGGNNDSLDDILGSGNYQCPDNQNVTISNNTATGVDFIVQLSGDDQIFGYVTDGNGNPIVGVNVYANDGMGDMYTNSTDDTGYYSFNVADGTWDISVDCGQLNNQGYPCISDQDVSVCCGNSVEQDFVACDEPLQITTTNLPTGVVNVPYDQFLQASSCYDNFTWSLNSGTLPPGLQLDSYGELFGTPGATGTYNFSVNVTDGNGNSTNECLSLIINLPTPVLSAPAVINGGQLQLSLNGNAGDFYTVEFSTNLINWSLLLITNPPNSQPFSLDFPMTNHAGYYQGYQSGIAVGQSDFSFGAGSVGTPVFYVNVTNGVAVIPITRTNGLSRDECVNYSTSGGTAVSGCDYEPQSGTLCFAAGVSSNSISIPVSLGCSATNQSATVDLQLSSTNGSNVLNALLVIQRPPPVLAVYPSSVTLTVPDNCGQTITISNAGPQGSVLNYTVVDDGALSGYLNLMDNDPNAYVASGPLVSGSLQSGQAAQVAFTVLDQFATNWIGGALTTTPDIYTPGAANYVKYPLSVTIEPEQTLAQSLLGTWSGTWAGTNVSLIGEPSGPDLPSTGGGAWQLNIQSVQSTTNGDVAITGTISLQGADNFYFSYYDVYIVPVTLNMSGQILTTYYTNGIPVAINPAFSVSNCGNHFALDSENLILMRGAYQVDADSDLDAEFGVDQVFQYDYDGMGDSENIYALAAFSFELDTSGAITNGSVEIDYYNDSIILSSTIGALNGSRQGP